MSMLTTSDRGLLTLEAGGVVAVELGEVEASGRVVVRALEAVWSEDDPHGRPVMDVGWAIPVTVEDVAPLPSDYEIRED